MACITWELHHLEDFIKTVKLTKGGPLPTFSPQVKIWNLTKHSWTDAEFSADFKYSIGFYLSGSVAVEYHFSWSHVRAVLLKKKLSAQQGWKFFFASDFDFDAWNGLNTSLSLCDYYDSCVDRITWELHHLETFIKTVKLTKGGPLPTLSPQVKI